VRASAAPGALSPSPEQDEGPYWECFDLVWQCPHERWRGKGHAPSASGWSPEERAGLERELRPFWPGASEPRRLRDLKCREMARLILGTFRFASPGAVDLPAWQPAAAEAALLASGLAAELSGWALDVAWSELRARAGPRFMKANAEYMAVGNEVHGALGDLRGVGPGGRGNIVEKYCTLAIAQACWCTARVLIWHAVRCRPPGLREALAEWEAPRTCQGLGAPYIWPGRRRRWGSCHRASTRPGARRWPVPMAGKALPRAAGASRVKRRRLRLAGRQPLERLPRRRAPWWPGTPPRALPAAEVAAACM
jgi:hypothetical protein